MIQNRFNQSIEKIIGKATFHKVALSISGGSDSIALLHLFTHWAKTYKIKIVVFSVNHKIRPEADGEIEFVKNIAQKLGHDFYTLNWDYDGNKSGLQERAREARYKLMTEKCHELNINILLTAHHLDDMLENYVMRLRKKSGIFGLSYSSQHFNNDIQILRPLLIFTKNELLNYLLEKNIPWVEDSSNSSDIYERNRVRMELENLTPLEKDQLFNKLHQCNNQAQDLNIKLINIIAQYVYISKFGFALLDIKKIMQQNLDIKIQLLNHVLTIIAGKNIIPRFRNINKIITLLNANQIINHSLHGCILKTFNNKLLILREKSQIDNNISYTRSGLLWDNRFLFKFKLAPDFKIETLNINEYVQLKPEINIQTLIKDVGNNHKLILFTLPIVKNLEKIIAIPHINYYDKIYFKDTLQTNFSPCFVSRFTHFL